MGWLQIIMLVIQIMSALKNLKYLPEVIRSIRELWDSLKGQPRIRGVVYRERVKQKLAEYQAHRDPDRFMKEVEALNVECKEECKAM